MTTAKQRVLPFARSIASYERLDLCEFLLANLGVAKTARALNLSRDALYRWRKYRADTDSFYWACRPPPSAHADKLYAARIIAAASSKSFA